MCPAIAATMYIITKAHFGSIIELCEFFSLPTTRSSGSAIYQSNYPSAGYLIRCVCVILKKHQSRVIHRRNQVTVDTLYGSSLRPPPRLQNTFHEWAGRVTRQLPTTIRDK